MSAYFKKYWNFLLLATREANLIPLEVTPFCLLENTLLKLSYRKQSQLFVISQNTRLPSPTLLRTRTKGVFVLPRTSQNALTGDLDLTLNCIIKNTGYKV